jgi:hypothetical protein
LVSQKNNVIVESLSEKKRFPIFNTNKISALSDISIYTYDEEVPLSDIYKKIFEKTDGAKTITHTDSQEKLKQEFESLVPNYDKEQVYNSDIRKLFQWYNILHETKKLKLKEDPKSAEKAEKKEASKKQPKEEKESK